MGAEWSPTAGALVAVLVANAVVALAYLAYGLLVRPALERVRSEGRRARRGELLRRFSADEPAAGVAADEASASDEASAAHARPVPPSPADGAPDDVPAEGRDEGDGGYQTRLLDEGMGVATDDARLSSPAPPGPDASPGRLCYALRAGMMLLFPVVGVTYLALGALCRRVCFHADVNIEDVVFSKERTVPDARADLARETNVAPIEEAVAVADSRDLRGLVLRTLGGDARASLGAMARVMNSDDSESAHYAATYLADELNDFRLKARRLLGQIREDERGSERLVDEALRRDGAGTSPTLTERDREWVRARLLARECGSFIQLVGDELAQGVFTDVERREWTEALAEAADVLYRHAGGDMTPEQFDAVITNLVRQRAFDQARLWCDRLDRTCPTSLTRFDARLRLAYATGDRATFARTLSELKASPVVVDRRMLGVIRLFDGGRAAS
ncbi:hypothetical protein I3I95_05070 [bacterium]|nr:hypothetical protein [bacterium]